MKMLSRVFAAFLITATLSACSTPIAEQSWINYSNDDFQIAIEYPESWFFQESREQFSGNRGESTRVFAMMNEQPDPAHPFGKEGSMNITLSVFESELSVNDWFDQYGIFSETYIGNQIIGATRVFDPPLLITDADFNVTRTDEIMPNTPSLSVSGKVPFATQGPMKSFKAYYYGSKGKVYEFLASTVQGDQVQSLFEDFDLVMEKLRFL